MPETSRNITVLLVQTSGTGLDLKETRAEVRSLVERELAVGPADFVVLPELATMAYFCGSRSASFFDWAESIPGPTTAEFSDLAKRYRVNVCLPLYERGRRQGEFYNSALIIDRDGQIVPGSAGTSTVLAYRKNHLANNHAFGADIGTNEKYYFRPGSGFPVFETDVAKVGILICYDRCFPESWRMLGLAGAEIVFVPIAGYSSDRIGVWTAELQAAAIHNGVFVVAVNRGGPEIIEGERIFLGRSLVVDPFGHVLAEGPANTGGVVLRQTIDLEAIERHGRRHFYYRDRRPEIYGELVARR